MDLATPCSNLAPISAGVDPVLVVGATPGPEAVYGSFGPSGNSKNN